jgi:hypothetical protein
MLPDLGILDDAEVARRVKSGELVSMRVLGLSTVSADRMAALRAAVRRWPPKRPKPDQAP